MPPSVNQEINVNINALVKKIQDVREFVSLLKSLRTSGSGPVILDQKISDNAKASIGDVTQLSTAIDTLGQKIDNLKPSKLAELSTLLQGFLAGSNILRNLGGTFENISSGISLLRTKGRELIEGVAARAGPILESLKTGAVGLVAELPLVGAGGAEAAAGIGAVAAGAGVAAGAVLIVVAAIVALVAIIAAVTTALAAAVPALVKYAIGFATAKVSSDDLKQSLIDGLPVHDAYRKRLEASAAKSGEVGKQSRELQGLLFQLRSIWNQLTDAAGGFVDQLAQRVIPIINQFLRVAVHTFDEIASIIGGLDGILTPFFDFVLFNIDNIGKALVWLETRAIATAKGLLAALSIGFATGSLSQGAAAFIDTFQQTVADLDKIANTKTEFGPGGGRTSDAGAGGKDKKGGGGRTPTAPADTSESQFALDKAIAEARFNQIKDSLDRENKLVQERYDERRLTIADYYAEQLRIQDEAIEAEIIKTAKELNAEQFKLATALQKIAADRKSGNIKTDAEAEAKVTNELNKTKATSVALSEKLNELNAKKADLPHDIELKEKADTDALNASLQQQIDALDTLRGIGPLVQVRQQIAEIDKLIEQFADNPGMVRFLEEWRELVGIMGQLEAVTTRLQKQNQVNDARIATLQTQGNQNVITRLLADQKIVALKKEELKATEEALAEALALGAKDQDSLARIEQLRASIAQLKIETRSFQQQLKDTAIDNLASGFETFIVTIGKGIKSFQDLKKAALDFLNSFLQGLLQVIAHKLALDLVAGLLGTGKTNSSGQTDNGAFGRLASFLSGLFGGKKAAGDMMSARPGGQLIQVAEAGYDELVASTDPRHAVRTSALLGAFIRRTGIVPSFGAGGFARSVANSLTTIPRLAAGGMIAAGPNLAFAGAAGGGHQLPPKVIIAVSEEEIANASMSSAGEKVWLYHFNKNRRAIFG